MPEPEVASRRQRLDGSCCEPGAVDCPGTTIPVFFVVVYYLCIFCLFVCLFVVVIVCYPKQ
jgi:hypothetical protein